LPVFPAAAGSVGRDAARLTIPREEQ
jgi:hypothetical protein